ncbi:MAG: NADH-quinone oxidoreductase subunit J [Runella sp.]
MIQIAFGFFAFLTLASALVILFTRNVMYAALCLFITLLGTAGLFVLAGADFLAVSQLLIYIGGVLVLLIFGVMLTYRPHRADDSQAHNKVITSHLNRFWGVSIALVFFSLAIWLIGSSSFSILQNPSMPLSHSTLKQTGMHLMTTHVWAFEVVGILLLVALVGAAYIATSSKTKSS